MNIKSILFLGLLIAGCLSAGCASKLGGETKAPIASIQATTPPPDVQRQLDQQRASHPFGGK